MASAAQYPPGAIITPVPVALLFSGRYAVSVGVTTFKTTVPTGVFSITFSFCVQFSVPGGASDQMFTVCGPRVFVASVLLCGDLED